MLLVTLLGAICLGQIDASSFQSKLDAIYSDRVVFQAAISKESPETLSLRITHVYAGSKKLVGVRFLCESHRLIDTSSQKTPEHCLGTLYIKSDDEDRPKYELDWYDHDILATPYPGLIVTVGEGHKEYATTLFVVERLENLLSGNPEKMIAGLTDMVRDERPLVGAFGARMLAEFTLPKDSDQYVKLLDGRSALTQLEMDRILVGPVKSWAASARRKQLYLNLATQPMTEADAGVFCSQLHFIARDLGLATRVEAYGLMLGWPGLPPHYRRKLIEQCFSMVQNASPEKIDPVDKLLSLLGKENELTPEARAGAERVLKSICRRSAESQRYAAKLASKQSDKTLRKLLMGASQKPYDDIFANDTLAEVELTELRTVGISLDRQDHEREFRVVHVFRGNPKILGVDRIPGGWVRGGWDLKRGTRGIAIIGDEVPAVGGYYIPNVTRNGMADRGIEFRSIKFVESTAPTHPIVLKFCRTLESMRSATDEEISKWLLSQVNSDSVEVHCSALAALVEHRPEGLGVALRAALKKSDAAHALWIDLALFKLEANDGWGKSAERGELLLQIAAGIETNQDTEDLAERIAYESKDIDYPLILSVGRSLTLNKFGDATKEVRQARVAYYLHLVHWPDPNENSISRKLVGYLEKRKNPSQSRQDAAALLPFGPELQSEDRIRVARLYFTESDSLVKGQLGKVLASKWVIQK